MLYLGKTMDTTIVQQSGYKPTPFSSADNTYRGTLLVQNDQPVQLVVQASARGLPHYIQVTVECVSVSSAPGTLPITLTVDALERVAAIGKAMGVPIGTPTLMRDLAPNPANPGGVPDKLQQIRNYEVLIQPYPLDPLKGFSVVPMDPSESPSKYYPYFTCLVTERTIAQQPATTPPGHRPTPDWLGRILNLVLNAEPWLTPAAIDRIHRIAQRALEQGKQYQTSAFSLRFVKDSRAHLSMMQGRNTAMIEMDMLTGTYGGAEIMYRYESSMYSLGGRPHWGLEFDSLTGNNDLLRKMYPKLDRWLKVYRQFNALGTFDNAFTQRMGFTVLE